MSFHDAAQQFGENITLLGGEEALSHDDPEKYNLYAGLRNLAQGLQALAAEVDALRHEVRALRR